MNKEDKEWCIALEDVGWYDNPVFGRLPIFHKGEQTTKEKVFFQIPDMTEKEYAKHFRPATEEETSREQCCVKTIKEKAQEWADMYPSCGMADKSFQAGATYVLDILEQALTPQRCLTDMGMDICPEALVKTALQTIEDLKK